jgi:ribosomal protein S18 acetylase RimI-like enzyme
MVIPMSPELPRLQMASLDEANLERFQGFSCGKDPWQVDLEDFLKNDALDQQALLLSKTYVFYSMNRDPVGFVALSTDAIEMDDKAVTPYKKVATLLIGRLAVDVSCQRQGYGRTIMAWVRSEATGMRPGCRFLTVSVEKENASAISFYQSQHFVPAPVESQDPRLLHYIHDLAASLEDMLRGAEAARIDAGLTEQEKRP